MAPAARIAHGCDVIDVDAEAQVRSLRHAITQTSEAAAASNS
jgi:hypothetical protein